MYLLGQGLGVVVGRDDWARPRKGSQLCCQGQGPQRDSCNAHSDLRPAPPRTQPASSSAGFFTEESSGTAGSGWLPLGSLRDSEHFPAR